MHPEVEQARIGPVAHGPGTAVTPPLGELDGS